MKTVKIVIEFEMKGDVDDEEALRESVYDYLEEAMETDELEFTADEVDEEDEDDEAY